MSRKVRTATWLAGASNVKDVLHSGKRDRLEIIAELVAVTQKPANITRIRGQLHLNNQSLKKYIRLMLRLCLIETCKQTKKVTGNGQVFQATEKGLAFFRTYCELLRIVYGEDFLKIDCALVVTCHKY